MGDFELEKRVEALRTDFAKHSPYGKPFEHFFCPILMRDEPKELCRAHIENAAFGTNNEWLPQRRDVDTFFGSVVEADLISVVNDRNADPAEIWLDAKRRRTHRPKLVYQGKSIEHYFPKDGSKPVAGHTRGTIVKGENSICDVSVKISPELVQSMDGSIIEIVIEKDYRPQVIASMLKAAHLTMFKMLGYEYVFSPAGLWVADILRTFFNQFSSPRECSAEHVETYFRQYQSMVAPFMSKGNVLQGTLNDNTLMSCFSASDAPFAIGVLVRTGKDMFCVFLPGMGNHIDTYLSFLNVPPPSVAARTTRFRPKDESGDGCWEIPPGDPMRIELNQKFPEDEAAVATATPS